MNTQNVWGRNLRVWGCVVAVVGGLAGGSWAQQDTVALAPPVVTDGDAEQDTVFHWQEIPQGQQVALERVRFDKAGYQLYDTVGETIIVPFVNDNLYVMKFGRATGTTMYFVNDGGQPTLYVPENGYLENATAEGGKWYPFPKQFQPAQPVYLGLAPSYADYASMGWYPGMATWGGYYSATPWVVGSAFAASPGLYFQIGNQPYYGWGGYNNYYRAHPYYTSIGVYRPSYYRPRGTLRPYAFGNNTYYAHRPFGGVQGWGTGRPSNRYTNGKLLNGILPSNAVTGRPSYNRYNSGNRYNGNNRDNRDIRNNSNNGGNRYSPGTIPRDPRFFRGGTSVLPGNRPPYNGTGRPNTPGSFSRPNGGNFNRPSGGTFRSPTSGGNRGGGGGRRGH